MIMNEQTFYLLKIWLENAPESCHPYDMERFYQFVYTLLEYDDGILNSDDFFRIMIGIRNIHNYSQCAS